MSLADILEEAASALPGDADAIRPANGDPFQLLEGLGAEGAGRVLAWVLANGPEDGIELALAWLDVEGGPKVLAAVDEKALPKPGRKALRKVLHRLRSQGVNLPSRERAQPVVSRLPEVRDEISAGFVSALDPRGSRLVYLVEPNPSGGARLFEILLDENRGVVDFEVYSAARGRIRRFVKDAVGKKRIRAVEATPESLRALVARIAARHPADRIFPQSFGEWRSKVAVEGATPGDLAAEALGTVDDTDGLARAAELVKKGTVGPWGPSPQELADRVEERLSDQAKTEPDEAREAELWQELAELIAGGEHADTNAQRFRESAYVFWKLDQEDDARACLCAAEAFANQPVSENPVAVTMTEVLLAPALEGLRARVAEEAGAGEPEAE
jgi:hypothetical protein